MVLSFLCDDVLDGEAMREALQERLDNSDDVKREMREAVAEKKGTLKVLPPPSHPVTAKLHSPGKGCRK